MTTLLSIPPALNPPGDAIEFADEDLLLEATQRWQDCRREMLALMAGAPTVRSSINRLLKEQWQLDGERVVLQFTATPQRGRSRMTLTEACLYMQQRPSLDTTQVPEGSVLNMPAQHVLSYHTVATLLDELKTLDLEQAIDDNWLRYWRTERAPNAPVTCLKRATELYRIHFEASGEYALAKGKLNPAALSPLFSLINPAQPARDATKIYAEQLLLKPVAADAIALPGAWVLTLDIDEPVAQLVYLPTQAPAWKCFAKRADMERWLLDRQPDLFSTPGVDPLATIEYSINTKPLEAGINLWFKQLAKEQYQDAIKPAANIEIHNAHLARLHMDQLDALRLGRSLFAFAPEPPEVNADTLNDPDFLQFGQLHNGVALRQRKALLQQQRRALDSLLGSDTPTSPRWQSFKQQLDALRVQQQVAEEAARAMLNRPPLDLAALNTHYTALYQARHQGLRNEARIQRTLNQISEDELHLIETALATPEPDVVALTLSVTRPGDTTPTLTDLNGPLVFLPPMDPQTPTTRDGTHFVYWPGGDGALQRFASRQALEEGLFAIQPLDSVLALQFKVLTQDPFDYSLGSQQTAFDEQAAHLRQTWSAPEHAATLAEALENLRAQTLPGLLVPDNSAREAAHLQLIEQHNARLLGEQLPRWMGTQTTGNREALRTLLRTYIPALIQSQSLIERSLPARDVFVRQKIDRRLRKDFAIKKAFTLQLELPDSVAQKKHIIAGAAPGAAVESVEVPSQERSTIALDQLALRNIGTDISPRLGFANITVTAEDASELNTLKAGVTKHYLASMVKDLNLAQKYEHLIRETFLGAQEESTHQKQYRRECLIQPLRLMLKAQGMLALMQNHIVADELDVLNISIDADAPDAWAVGGKRIRLLPAHLSAGGKDTHDESPITLSGVTFIEERNSGKTLLYLPDVPDQRFLRGYDNLEQARIALFELCRLDSMVNYVASRALKGDVQAHIGRIDQATVKGYNAMIQAGLPWPASTSLATHQLDAHMGRLIEAHRNDARSNADLADEKYALKSGQLFNGIKIALGLVPVLGATVSLADATTSLYQAVAAFRRGEIGDGIEQLASVFECLVFAAMDAVPLAAAPSARGSTARLLTLARQQKQHPGGTFWRSLKTRQGSTTRHRFAGYQHPEALDGVDLRPVHTGPYRHTLRHTSGEYFILSEGEYCKVRFDPTTHEMRLVAPGKNYSPAIALDNALQWDTYSALHGGHLTGYGGGSRGRGAARAGANVPPAVSRQLPPPALEVSMGRLEIGRSLLDRIREYYPQVERNTAKLNKYVQDYPNPIEVTPQKLRDGKTLDIDLAKDMEDGKNMYAAFKKAKQENVHLSGWVIDDEMSSMAHIVSSRLSHLIQHASNRALALTDRLIALTDELNTPSLLTGRRQVLTSEIRQYRLDLLDELNRIEVSIKDMNTWAKRITHRTAYTQIATELDSWKRKFTDLRMTSLRSGHLMQALTLRPQTFSIDWVYLERAVHNARNRFDRTGTTHMTLNEANVSRVERNRILQNCITVYEELSRDLIAWNDRSPNHFDQTFLPLLQEDIKRLIQKAQRAIKKPASKPKTNATQAVFETDDGQLLIGTEKPAGQQSPRQFIINNADGEVIEVWDSVGDRNTFRLNTASSRPVAAPRALATDINAVVAEAQARLDAVDAFQHKVQGYKTMEPINLEHMLTSEANALETRARHVQSLDAANPVIEHLRSRARVLEQSGQALRIERSLASKTPTEGYLDYLMQKGRVVIRKAGARRKLRDKRPDGQDDYLQEYAVYDSTRQGQADKPIWFAHFHYVAQRSPFESFEKAHLKVYEQQYLGMKWQAANVSAGATFADVKIWRGDIDKPVATQYFKPLG